MNGEYIYDITERPKYEDSTKSYEYHPFFPTDSSDLNKYSIIRFDINARDNYYHIHEAYFELHGQVVKADGNPYPSPEEKADRKSSIAFIHNPFPYMFRNFTYKLNGTIVDTVNYPGPVSSLLHNVMFNSTKPYEGGLEFLWYPDRNRLADETNKGWKIRRELLITEPKTAGNFVMKIPVSMLIGIGSYTKVITKVSHQFEMTRQEDYFSLFRGADLNANELPSGIPNVDTAAGKINMKSLVLMIPIVKPEGRTQIMLKEAELSAKEEFIIAFRQRRGLMAAVPDNILNWTWSLTTINMKDRPQYLFVGFQHGRTTDQLTNYALYDNENVQRMYVSINNQQFPASIEDANFNEVNYGSFYKALQDVRSNYLQIDPLINESGINPLTFKNLLPIFCFDLTKHVKDIRGDVVTARLETQFAVSTGDRKIKAFACLINDKEVFITSDGGNITIK